MQAAVIPQCARMIQYQFEAITKRQLCLNFFLETFLFVTATSSLESGPKTGTIVDRNGSLYAIYKHSFVATFTVSHVSE